MFRALWMVVAVAACDSDSRAPDVAADGAAVGDAAMPGMHDTSMPDAPTPDASSPPDGSPADAVVHDVNNAAEQARIFSTAAIVQVSIELSEHGFARLLAEPRTYVPAAVTIDGQGFPRVGLRLKGHSTFRPISRKASFKIELDHYVDGSHFYGLRKLTFNNMLADHSKLGERLASVAFPLLGVPAPRAGYAQISINGERYGLYSHLETPDEVFLERAYPGAQHGPLYEGTFDQDLWPRFVDGFELDAGRDERGLLRDVVKALNRATPASFHDVVGEVVDIPAVLRFFAAESLTGHWDGYSKGRANYFIYLRSSDDRLVFFPWSADLTWRRSQSALTGRARLFRMCVDWLPCRLEYAQTIRELTELFEAYDWGAEIDEVLALTGPAFAADPKNSTTLEARAQEVAGIRDFINEQPARILDSLTCLDPADDADGDLTLACAGDCDDGDPTIYPSGDDSCDDDIDQNCSGYPDDGVRCPVCRPFEAPTGATFLICQRPESYHAPQRICEEHGAVLASLRSAEEHDAVAAAAFARRRTCWSIGLRAANGAHTWLDGAPLDYTRWADGEPSSGDTCTCLDARTNGWNDVHCGHYKPFICRR